MEDPIRGMMKEPSVVAIKTGLRLATSSVDRVVSIQERLSDIGCLLLHVLSECRSRRTSCLSQADQGQRGLSRINAQALSPPFISSPIPLAEEEWEDVRWLPPSGHRFHFSFLFETFIKNSTRFSLKTLGCSTLERWRVDGRMTRLEFLMCS
jgi:hypothetical protein